MDVFLFIVGFAIMLSPYVRVMRGETLARVAIFAVFLFLIWAVNAIRKMEKDRERSAQVQLEMNRTLERIAAVPGVKEASFDDNQTDKD